MARTKADTRPSCEWKVDEDGIYRTDCGQMFIFTDDGPMENGMKFCCYCGKNLHAARVAWSSWMRRVTR